MSCSADCTMNETRSSSKVSAMSAHGSMTKMDQIRCSSSRETAMSANFTISMDHMKCTNS